MKKVTLFEVLSARDRRVEKQKELLKNGFPIVCFTMNIAGEVKNTPLIERAFNFGLTLLEESLDAYEIVAYDEERAKTGCCAYMSINADGKKIKEICVNIEESTPIGRLFDIDVILPSGKKLERANERGCLICGKAGRECAASRAHSADELFEKTQNIIKDHFARQNVFDLAIEALLYEVNVTPKPGLVDRQNNGSHSDMCQKTFLKSAKAIKPYFEKCFLIGKNSGSSDEKQLFALLKSEGIKAEEQMRIATGGVNTHAGAIYSFGILLATIGKNGKKLEEIFLQSSKIALASGDKNLFGVRAQVASGFPQIKISLPYYIRAIEDGLSLNQAGVQTLLKLIATTEDTNVLRRGGKECADWVKQKVQEAIKDGYAKTEVVENLDKMFIQKNVSPGGCADLLAITYFLYFLN